MSGVQCKKRLYLHKNHKKFGIERDEITAQQEAIFSTGTSVGELAQKLFPGGIDCTPESYFDFGPSLDLTKQSIVDGKTVIYEAAFQYDQVLVALDILVKKDDGWHAYEVKSTNDTKPQHIHDAALQYWVMTNAGLNIQTINILHFNKEYVRRGELNIEELFTWDDITENVEEILPKIRPEVKACKAVLQEPEVPIQDIGPHCSDPYDCDFRGHCWKHVPEYSVLNLTNPRGKQWDLYQQGIMTIEDIPEGYPLSTAQQHQVEAEKTGESFINPAEIAEFTSQLTYPLYFMDFETIQSAIPIYDETRPYQMAVFQYSVHIQEEKDGSVVHKEYLGDPKDRDLRKTVAQRLIADMGANGCVIVYNNSFEGPRLNELSRDYPDLASKLQAIAGRIVDLAVPFRRKAYYTADMQGKYSIKKVLPALVPELSYKDLEIQEGGTASLTFLQMIQGEFRGDEAKAREALIKYCELDTLAMVKILETLNNT
jgi:hypothetical protein